MEYWLTSEQTILIGTAKYLMYLFLIDYVLMSTDEYWIVR